jgi:hypothetical protein
MSSYHQKLELFAVRIRQMCGLIAANFSVYVSTYFFSYETRFDTRSRIGGFSGD